MRTVSAAGSVGQQGASPTGRQELILILRERKSKIPSALTLVGNHQAELIRPERRRCLMSDGRRERGDNRWSVRLMHRSWGRATFLASCRPSESLLLRVDPHNLWRSRSFQPVTSSPPAHSLSSNMQQNMHHPVPNRPALPLVHRELTPASNHNQRRRVGWMRCWVAEAKFKSHNKIVGQREAINGGGFDTQRLRRVKGSESAPWPVSR
ncbi:unnamed protein product [Pleuronectes platessa]|uniref:Uncharacterized protein n=1 Tax=Pleuronectes platessa TaxID=8262 RepID=A0A9N7VR39_PLEPL|nr:unnamed protein product [Pleuronectes platessa]